MSAQLSSMKKEYDAVVAEAHTMAFVQVLRRHPQATFKEVAKLADEMGMSHLTVEQCFMGKLPSSGKQWAKETKALTAGTVSTAKKSDRQAYDQKIYDWLEEKGGWNAATEIRSACGGTAEQARKALNRLIVAGKIDYKGRARATKYKAQ